MEIGNLYIEVPIGTLCCFLFLLFSFMNTPKTKQVRSMQMMLLSCIVWTGGDLFMRLMLYPGAQFWYAVSIVGLLMIPVPIYYFLFDILNIHREKVLVGYFLVSCGVGVVNGVFGLFIKESQNTVGEFYTYSSTYGVYVLIIAELIFMIYATALANQVIGNDLLMRKKLVPLLIGSLCILFGNVFETLSADKFPYGSIGGVMMAVCVTYMLYSQYLFDVSKRLQIGAIYTVAAFLVFTPIWQISSKLSEIADRFSISYGRLVLVAAGLLSAWAMVVVFHVFKLAKRLEQRQSERQFEQLQVFQKEALSIFDIGELCHRIFRAMLELIEDAEVSVAIRDITGDFEFIDSKSEGIVARRSQEEIEEAYEKLSAQEDIQIVSLRYDDSFQGYLYLKKKKTNYHDLSCFQQLASDVSICLKNIHIYQKRYQITIHDELTGLYNRRYFKEFTEKQWSKQLEQAFLYMDIDNFKLFNELYGEECGDNILRWCGGVIEAVVGSSGKVFRMGSNEYLVHFLEENREGILSIAKAVQEKLKADADNKPKVLQQITMSIGLAIKSTEETSPDELFKQAERAALFAKQNGRNCIEIYGEKAERDHSKTRGVSAYEQISSTVYALTAAINAKDSYTFDHSMHVSQYAVLLAKELGLDSNEVRIVKEAGMLHDIGKIGVPENILQKNGPLTDEEYEIMKSHVAKSVEMIHFLPNMNYVIPAVISHHERYDGKGYPRGIAGEEIPLLGRILTVCDCYDAMVSKRSYKVAFSKDFAIEELQRNKGTQFDPELVDIFVTLIPLLDKYAEEDGRVG